MPHVLKDTTIQFIGTDELPTVRMLLKMSRAAGAVWLQINRPTWPQDITDDMLKLCSTATAVNSYQSLEEQRTYRRHFCAAAWIMGASWSTLGAFFNVSRESISSSVNRILPTQVRELTGRPPHISFARVEELYEGYKRIMASIPLKEIQSLSARELGQLLDATAPKPDDEGEDTLSVGIQNRIPSVDLS